MDNTGSAGSTVLFAVRHGETEWNLIGKQQGHLDSPLTEAGIRQAHALATGLVNREIEVIYSSDLGRAMHTARIIGARLDLSINIDQRLRERHLGSLQGMTKQEFRNNFPEEFTALSSGDPEYVLPGGESVRQRFERCITCCTELVGRHPDGKVLIVAHGGVLNSLFYHSLGIPLKQPRRFSLFNAAINSFSVWSDHWRLDSWGDTSHLKGINTIDDN